MWTVTKMCEGRCQSTLLNSSQTQQNHQNQYESSPVQLEKAQLNDLETALHQQKTNKLKGTLSSHQCGPVCFRSHIEFPETVTTSVPFTFTDVHQSATSQCPRVT